MKVLARLAMAISLMFVCPLSLTANDSHARIDAGGIVLLRSEGISMLREVLRISPDRIDVAYVFRNKTAENLSIVAAFPMPRYLVPWYGDRHIGKSGDPVSFRVDVDGQPVTFKTEVKKTPASPDDCNGPETCDWIQVTHHWTQLFPTGRDLRISHTYRPVAGSSFCRLFPVRMS